MLLSNTSLQYEMLDKIYHCHIEKTLPQEVPALKENQYFQEESRQ